MTFNNNKNTISNMNRICQRCQYDWKPRGLKKPKCCPKCKSYFWDLAREVDHKDGDVNNNSIDNLEIVERTIVFDEA